MAGAAQRAGAVGRAGVVLDDAVSIVWLTSSPPRQGGAGLRLAWPESALQSHNLD